MPILIKNESFNNIFLWKLCFIENNSFLCIIKLKKRRIMKYVIIGGVAGGATAAARLRRVDEMAEILFIGESLTSRMLIVVYLLYRWSDSRAREAVGTDPRIFRQALPH